MLKWTYKFVPRVNSCAKMSGDCGKSNCYENESLNEWYKLTTRVLLYADTKWRRTATKGFRFNLKWKVIGAIYTAGNWITRRLSDHRKETQTAVVLSCLPFIRSGQNHLARHSERGKKTRQREEEVGRQHQEMDRPGVRQIPEGSGEQGKMEETGCKVIRGAPTTLTVKG